MMVPTYIDPKLPNNNENVKLHNKTSDYFLKNYKNFTSDYFLKNYKNFNQLSTLYQSKKALC